MYLLKTYKYENLWWRIENRVHDLIEEKGAFEERHIVEIIRSFSRAQDNRMAGSDKLFVHFEPTVLSKLNNFSSRDLSHIMYGYSIRQNVGNPELYKAINNRLTEKIDGGEIFDYPTISNMLYYMMFQDNTDRKIWEGIVNSAIEQNDIIPLTYYKPFKYSKFFLEHHFKDWDLWQYTDKFYYAERYFN